MEHKFSLKGINKHYHQGDNELTVFNGLDVDIEAGEFLSIMGPSGTGKTTLLNIIGGIDQIDEGRIFYDGHDMTDWNEKQLARWRSENIGFVFQNYNLLSMLTAEENVELPLLLTNIPKKERDVRVKSALELVDLNERARHLPGALSGGQQQRVAIARALVADTPVLLCDEPTGNLDHNTTHETMDVLALLNKELKKTIIMVTHDNETAKYASRRIVLSKGTYSQH